MQPQEAAAPVLVARRVPKRARKVPKKTSDPKSVENFLILIAFAGGLLVVRFLGVIAGFFFALLCGIFLLLHFITRWARRREAGNLPPKPGTR